jgi:hypothetical protein
MRKSKQVNSSNETSVKVVPASANGCMSPSLIAFKEEQRLDWQQKYLTQLCEADSNTIPRDV